MERGRQKAERVEKSVMMGRHHLKLLICSVVCLDKRDRSHDKRDLGKVMSKSLKCKKTKKTLKAEAEKQKVARH